MPSASDSLCTVSHAPAFQHDGETLELELRGTYGMRLCKPTLETGTAYLDCLRISVSTLATPVGEIATISVSRSYSTSRDLCSLLSTSRRYTEGFECSVHATKSSIG